MFIFIYLGFALIYLVCAYFILERVRKDYAAHGSLHKPTSNLEVVMFFLHGCLIGLSYGAIDSWPPASPFSAIVILGVGLALIGLGKLLAALRVFGPFWRMLGLNVEGLKQAGIYRRSRNPQLVGYWLMVLAIPIVWPSWYAFASVLLYWPMAHRMVLIEEQHLTAQFGEEYLEYCRQTPRYIGRATFKIG
ncbi:MAG: isoprenylcysteine carboxylmethyltransferase family protein [Chloroflexota bacterium]